MTNAERATKRIPVCPSTWETIHQMKKLGQTFDDVINELLRNDPENRLIDEMERKRKRGAGTFRSRRLK